MVWFEFHQIVSFYYLSNWTNNVFKNGITGLVILKSGDLKHINATSQANKFEMLAMELFKKNSKIKAEAKEALYKMGRDHKDKESIDIMLENMWYGLDENEMAVWINKVRAKN